MSSNSKVIDSLITSMKETLIADSIAFTEIAPVGRERGKFILEIPGTNKLKTNVFITISEKNIDFEAFICRKPDENFAGVYKFLLKRNRKLYLASYTLDDLGDIYLIGKIATEFFSLQVLDMILGQIAQTADEDFNILLQLGFATSIYKEWKWRLARGESLVNLKPFEGLIQKLAADNPDETFKAGS